MAAIARSLSPPHGARGAAIAIVACVAVCGAAVLVPQQPLLALAVAGGLLVAALLVQGNRLLLVAAVPAVWLGEIVRLAGGALSISDAFLIVAALSALLSLDLSRRAVRNAVFVIASYQAVQLLAVVHALTAYAAQEWAHRLLLVTGGVLIGAALVRRGVLRPALQLFVAGGVVIAVLGVAVTFASALTPAYPLQQKNYEGDLLASALLIVLFVPRDVWTLRTRWRVVLLAVLGAGLLSTQSRGAMFALAFGLVVYALFSRRFDGRSFLLVLVTLTGLAFFATSFGGDLQVQLQQQYGSLFDRQLYAREAVQAWQTSPWLGAGIRFWETGLYALNSDPHDLILYTLGESGVIGLASLLVLLVGTGVVVFRSRSALAVLAVALLATRFAHGLVDVYWVHGSLAIPWVIAGAALALPRRATDTSATDAPPPAARRSAELAAMRLGSAARP